jgi:hypothetical protein
MEEKRNRVTITDAPHRRKSAEYMKRGMGATGGGMRRLGRERRE